MAFSQVSAHRGLVVARGGAVAASQPLAVSAGLHALARGGSFADAALAISAVLCVIEPHNSHLGGDAFLVVYDAARRETVALNGSGAAPASATPESYREGIPLRGVRAASVPGLVSTWFTLHERWGRLPVAELLAPAIAYAEEGFPAGPRFAKVCQGSAGLFDQHPSLAALGCRKDVRVGDPIRQPDLAGTLRQIAREGQDAFYRGTIADRLVAGTGGHFSPEDLATHRTRVLPPLTTRYRDLVVHGQPPPSQGHILLQELAMVEGFDLAALDEAERTHILVEAKKLAFADRNAYLADPERIAVPMEGLLSPEHAARQRARIDRERAASDYTAGDPNSTGSDTTYFLVSDRDGNAVSFIQSIFHGYGSATVVEGTGVLLNNRMTGFVLDPAHPNGVAPGKRPAHTLNAWLATRNGDLAFVGGTPGGHVQVQTNLQLLVNLVDGGMDPQAAIEAPRWQHLNAVDGVSSPEPFGPGVLEMEGRGTDTLVEDLRRRGHDARLIGPWAHSSSAQLLAVLPGGAVALGSDPRCDGQAAGI